MKNWNKPLIWVEGIIGCGKSTFARQVGKRLKLRVLEEPAEENPYLAPFYEDQKTYAFGFQMYMLYQRFAMQQLAAFESTGIGGYQGAILDRSLSGDRVFAKMHMQAGNINELDFKTYEMSYSIMCRTLLPPTLLVFLDAQPTTAFKRMQERGRKAEKSVPLDYLIKLREGYQELLQEAKKGLLPWSHAIDICLIPWDPDTVTDEQWNAVAATVKEQCR
jgi:deoxyadenosine/deoxycytidine kinase